MLLALDIGGTKVTAATFDWQASDRLSLFLTAEARSRRYRGVSAVTGKELYYKDYTVLHLGASFEATAIGVDPAGTQLAVGFADGAVLWIALETLRPQLAPVGPDVATQHTAAKLRCDKPAVTDYDALLEPEPVEDEDPY